VCDAESDDDCLDDWLHQYGDQLYRRPLTESQVEAYRVPFVGLKDDEARRDMAVQILSAMVLSPYFLFRLELADAEREVLVASGEWKFTPREWRKDAVEVYAVEEAVDKKLTGDGFQRGSGDLNGFLKDMTTDIQSCAGGVRESLNAMRSIEAPMIAMSRAASSSMRSTAAASHVGLSHSTQVRRPCSMASESNGRLAGFMRALLMTGHLVGESCIWRQRRYAARDPRLTHGTLDASLPGK